MSHPECPTPTKANLAERPEHPQYIVGFAPSGDWAAFNAAQKTCYAPTVHECLLKLQVMHRNCPDIDGGRGKALKGWIE